MNLISNAFLNPRPLNVVPVTSLCVVHSDRGTFNWSSLCFVLCDSFVSTLLVLLLGWSCSFPCKKKRLCVPVICCKNYFRFHWIIWDLMKQTWCFILLMNMWWCRLLIFWFLLVGGFEVPHPKADGEDFVVSVWGDQRPHIQGMTPHWVRLWKPWGFHGVQCCKYNLCVLSTKTLLVKIFSCLG
jgi:hypothetical protein